MSDFYKQQAETLRAVDHIVSAFRRYTVTSDKSLITGFSEEELEKTLNVFASSKGDRESGWYRAISRRLDEMDREEQNRRKTRDNVIGWIVAFLLGVVATLVSQLIIDNFL